MNEIKIFKILIILLILGGFAHADEINEVDNDISFYT